MEIKDFNNYDVSEKGKITNTLSGKERALDFNKSIGYYQVDLYKNNTRYKRYIHRLVAEAFIPNPLGLSEVNHIDSDRTNNHVSNLEWVSSSGNSLHASKSGRRDHVARMSKLEVKEAFELVMKGNSYRKVSEILKNSWQSGFLSVKVKQYARENNLVGILEVELKNQRIVRSLENLKSINK